MGEPKYDMTGKVVIITGANSGIGKRAAKALVETRP
jgi:NAD(P)-dependent dehydrogenase (short-subunit alcohol dehydrogenase family)